MSIHGLWPSLKSGASMSECNTGTQLSVTNDGSSLITKMKKYWPSLTGSDTTFWSHEYTKHGYCYKMGDSSYKSYSQKALDVSN